MHRYFGLQRWPYGPHPSTYAAIHGMPLPPLQHHRAPLPLRSAWLPATTAAQLFGGGYRIPPAIRPAFITRSQPVAWRSRFPGNNFPW